MSYFYLAGPMSGIPQFNFPEFDRIAKNLRSVGLNIISPAELDDPEARAAALACPTGRSQKVGDAKWQDYLQRDLNIIMDSSCAGVIVMYGWHLSKGARLETFVCQEFGKELYRYFDHGSHFGIDLIDRADELRRVRSVRNV